MGTKNLVLFLLVAFISLGTLYFINGNIIYGNDVILTLVVSSVVMMLVTEAIRNKLSFVIAILAIGLMVIVVELIGSGVIAGEIVVIVLALLGVSLIAFSVYIGLSKID